MIKLCAITTANKRAPFESALMNETSTSLVWIGRATAQLSLFELVVKLFVDLLFDKVIAVLVPDKFSIIEQLINSHQEYLVVRIWKIVLKVVPNISSLGSTVSRQTA